jgi:hypothetical protein
MPAFTGGYSTQQGELAFFKLFELTMRKYGTNLINTIKRSNPLLEKITASGGFKAKEGGVGIRNVDTILARPNDSMKFAKMEDPILTATGNYTEKLEWDWKFAYSGFSVNDNILQVNQSKPLFRIMEIEKKALEEGFRRFFARQIYAHGDTAIEIGGLPYLISYNPYQSTITGYNQAKGHYTYTASSPELWVFNLRRTGCPRDGHDFWRNRICVPKCIDKTTATTEATLGFTSNPNSTYFRNVSATNPITAYDASCKELVTLYMTRMVREIEANNPGLDLIICSEDFYDMYIHYIVDMTHVNISTHYGKSMDMGMNSIKFMGIPIQLDYNCPDGHMYFLNSKKIEFKYLKGANFTPIVKEKSDEWVHSYLTKFIGNMIITMPRSMGLIWNPEKFSGGASLQSVNGSMPSYVWTGMFTDARMTKYHGTCTYNMAQIPGDPDCTQTWAGYTNPDYTPYRHAEGLVAADFNQNAFPVGGDLSVLEDAKVKTKINDPQNSGFSPSGIWVIKTDVFKDNE